MLTYMVGSLNKRSLTLLIAVALATFAVVACETEQVQFYLTPTIASPGDLTAIGTHIPEATPLAPTRIVGALTPKTSSDFESLLPTVTPTPIVKQDIPEGYALTHIEAMALAEILGCSGWSSAKVGDVIYYRACADDAEWDRVHFSPDEIAALNAEATTTAVTQPSSATEVPAAPTPFVPALSPTTSSSTDPPPYHYTTADEANEGAAALGCSGWTRTVVDGVSYYRACGSNRDFEILSTGGATTLSGSPCTIESDPTAKFTALPTDLSQIASIIPPGSPAGGVIKPHSYLHNRNKSDGNNVRVPVYAVADSVLTSIAYYGTSVDTSEYLIFFDVTCEISFKFDHISEVAPKLAAVAPSTPADSSMTTETEAISFEAGELIGYSVGAGGFGAWDFGAYDLTYTNQFANQERYEAGYMMQSIHTICPYDNFIEPLRSQMYALFGTHDQRLLPNIECTTTERDVLGAASGAWFDSLNLEFSESKVSLGILPGELVAITGIGSDVRIDKGQPTWLDPALITDSHCYADDGRWFYLEIREEGMQLAIATGSGICPSALPSDATIYYR